jgi:hypothetical protein
VPISRALATDPICYPEVKSVKIKTANRYIFHVFQVGAFSSEDVNVAIGGEASQSSTQWPASNAIDGNDATVASTAGGDPNPSWQVDFTSSSSLKSVDIKNRHCAVPVCLYRLSGATVSLTDKLR